MDGSAAVKVDSHARVNYMWYRKILSVLVWVRGGGEDCVDRLGPSVGGRGRQWVP